MHLNEREWMMVELGTFLQGKEASVLKIRLAYYFILFMPQYRKGNNVTGLFNLFF
jgi:hypothetical protein